MQQEDTQETKHDIIGEKKVESDRKTAEEEEEKHKDGWFRSSLFFVLAVFVIVADYYFLILCTEDENWSANLIIGIFQLLVFIKLFPSIRLLFRQIISAVAKRGT